MKKKNVGGKPFVPSKNDAGGACSWLHPHRVGGDGNSPSSHLARAVRGAGTFQLHVIGYSMTRGGVAEVRWLVWV